MDLVYIFSKFSEIKYIARMKFHTFIVLITFVIFICVRFLISKNTAPIT